MASQQTFNISSSDHDSSDTDDELNTCGFLQPFRSLLHNRNGAKAVRRQLQIAKRQFMITRIPIHKNYNPQFSKRHGSVPCILKMVQQRNIGRASHTNFSPQEKHAIYNEFIPNEKITLYCYPEKAFSGTYSSDGEIFLSTCKDRRIRLYHTNPSLNCQQPYKIIKARNIGWSIIDAVFSPDNRTLAYTSWSDFVHICNVSKFNDSHEALRMTDINPVRNFCIFSCKFSTDSREIFGGSNYGNIVIYDLKANRRALFMKAHDHDVNAVAYADGSSNILYTGSDDGLLKVWDRRTLNEKQPIPVGIMAGHRDGITFIDSKDDGRYFITNSKDQSLKLWDIRRFSPSSTQMIGREAALANKDRWDYRWQKVPKKMSLINDLLEGDSSVLTLRQHAVLHTLIRCRFSPLHTTGQRFIYTGSATGTVVIYDSITGNVVKQLDGHNACVRDVSWHPYKQIIKSASWDTTIGHWEYKANHHDCCKSNCFMSTEQDIL